MIMLYTACVLMHGHPPFPAPLSVALREVDWMGRPLRHPPLAPLLVRLDDAIAPRTGRPLVTFADVLREREMLGDLRAALAELPPLGASDKLKLKE